ncbi:hypothetical protein BG011_007882 [Mortierella polycephala]|uniref:Uncharacterized protein n=1 Tax=Mortierella polycephala TaxID=41804 RepID=A0A9P6PQ26_9FUNG|nr:hypothetical protein BG011_007882 [Mortierella polycephala]
MRTLADTKNSSSFEVVTIDDHAPAQSQAPKSPLPSRVKARFNISPRSRLVAVALYQLINGLLSLYFCLIRTSTETIELCDSVMDCLFYSFQGWPALGLETMDLRDMSYVCGIVSLFGGVIGVFGIYSLYKESSAKVLLFGSGWCIATIATIVTTFMSLFLTINHNGRFLNQCRVEHDSVLGRNECAMMYAAALLGSLVACLVSVIMICCYGNDIARYSTELEAVKNKTRKIEDTL